MIEVPAELEERLQNWGRWCKPNKVRGRSSLLPIMREMGVPDSTASAPINVRDAEYVNARWRQMPFAAYEDRKIKLLVAYACTYDVNSSTILRLIRKEHKVRIQSSEYDRLLEEGIRRLGKKLGYVVNYV